MEIARTIADATPALDFEIPLKSDDPRWTDFSEARGANTIGRVHRLFDRQREGDRWLHVVFASHRGAGKTTELLRLANQLSDRFFTIYFEANVEMDANTFEMEDLLLVIARVVEEQMRLRDTPIKSRVLDDVEKWFSEVVLSDEQGSEYLAAVKTEAKAEAGVPFFAKLMASLTASFRVESTHRETVKRTLKKFPGTLSRLVNNVLDVASGVLAESNLRLLLLIDNMDRYDPRLIDQLLVQSADRFKTLNCNMIVTPPIGLVLRPQAPGLESVFRCETMPTVRLRKQSQGYWEFDGPGRESLLNALGKRIDLDEIIPETEARNRLASASGGAIRELLELAQDATLEAPGEFITLADVEKTLDRRQQRFRDRIDANGWWKTLLNIARTKRLDEEEDCLEVLFQRLAFQYNGEVWYDVHPLVTELDDFRTQYSPPSTSKKKRSSAAKTSAKKTKDKKPTRKKKR